MKTLLALLILGALVGGLIWRTKQGGHCGCGPAPKS